MHPPRWLLYLGGAGALLGLVVAVPMIGNRPERTVPLGQPLPRASLLDPAVWVSAPPPGPGAGTAFSVAERGVWLTARHVVEGCGRTVIVTAPGRGVAAEVRLAPGRETAVLLTAGGAPALPVAADPVLRQGQRAFHPGFPRQKPGEAASRLLRRARLWVGWRGLRAEPVLSFAETARAPAWRGSLEGLSGAPVLDSHGEVLGVTVAENPRRRRLYATTPGSLRAALATVGVNPSARIGRPLDDADWPGAADRLRAALSVAEVECLKA
jgi:S1-C subfamily serine protease